MFLPSLLLLKPTTADAEADAEVVSIHGQRRQRARRRFFQAVLEDDDRGVLEGIEAPTGRVAKETLVCAQRSPKLLCVRPARRDRAFRRSGAVAGRAAA